ncbi:MAG: hypothetical protein Q8K65_01065 [Alphaproteobacteria bacterium]|nr:hypothetical protein [Alphaproteobacteria bacterium]
MTQMDNQKTDSALAKLGYKALRNFDFVFAGLCLSFALASQPFTTSFYKEPLADAKARYEVLYEKADSVFIAANGQKAPEDSTLNMHLYNRRGESRELRELSDEFRSARVDVRRGEEMMTFANGYGYTCAVLFAGMGALSAGMGISARRRKKDGMSPD